MELGCVSALDLVGKQSGSQPHIAATVTRGDLEIAGLRVAVVELNDDSQATRFPLIEDGVIAFWVNGGEENDQANSDKRHSDSQRSMAHKTSHQLTAAKRQASVSIFEISLVLVVAARQTSHRPDPSALFCRSGNSFRPSQHSHAGRAGVAGPYGRSLLDPSWHDGRQR